MDKHEKIGLLKEAKDSGIQPETFNLFEGYPIKNAEHTADEKAAAGGCWKQYWKIFARQDFPQTCPFCGEPLAEDDIDGCHVNIGERMLFEDVFYSEKTYIIPGHHSCNMQLGDSFKCNIPIMAVEAIEK